jgi:arylsulfatase A-like enzyme
MRRLIAAWQHGDCRAKLSGIPQFASGILQVVVWAMARKNFPKKNHAALTRRGIFPIRIAPTQTAMRSFSISRSIKRLALALISVPCVHAESPVAAKPNIVLILSDDQAWSDYGFMGHKEIKTPHLDKLAARSLTFERGYVASPLCRPSLASLLTGKFPHQHGITGNDVDGNNNREALDAPMRKAFHQLPSFVRLLADNGYLAHQSGKWWEGSHSDGSFTHGMMPQPARHGNATSLAIGREGLAPITYFIDHAVASKKPFFVWYAPFLPHTPHTPPARLLKKYQAPGRAADVVNYYAMCDWFDETCGLLFAHLEAKGLSKNTVILYICDNGWVPASINSEDPHQAGWKDYALRSKGSPFENGIRTPILISWPGTITPARAPELAHAIDFFPTIAAITDLEKPDDLQGINLLDETNRKKRSTIFGVTHSVHNMSPGKPDDTLQYQWCVDGEWKLILRHHGKDTTRYSKVHDWDQTSFRLYNLKHDPREQNELSSQHPDIVEKLRNNITAWHKP